MWSVHGTVWKFKSREWIKREKAKKVAVTIPRKLLMMDLDGTIITTSSGRKFPKDATDWKWRWAQVPTTIQKYARNCSIVVVTNQSGLSNKRKKDLTKAQTEFKTKVEHIARELQVPLIVYVATTSGIYRKPNPMIFEDYIINDVPGMNKITYIMYVGDAAGRDGDFSDSDRKFAANIALNIKNIPNFISMANKTADKTALKIAFKTPEEFFLKRGAEPYKYVGFDPGAFLATYKKDPKTWSYIDLISPSEQQEMILMVGPPASGKSQISKLLTKTWSNYVRFSQDEHKTKTPKLVREALASGDSVIVDNTHGTREQRNKYINLIDVDEVKVRVIMTMGYSGAPNDKTKLDLKKKEDRAQQIEMAKHMNAVREKKNARAGYINQSKWISRVVYNKYNSSFDYPTKQEGIDEIIQVPFIPKFHNNRDLITFLEKTSI